MSLIAGQLDTESERLVSIERIYCVPLESRKGPARAGRIRELARHLPTKAVAERLGVSEGSGFPPR